MSLTKIWRVSRFSAPGTVVDSCAGECACTDPGSCQCTDPGSDRRLQKLSRDDPSSTPAPAMVGRFRRRTSREGVSDPPQVRASLIRLNSSTEVEECWSFLQAHFS